MCGPKYLKNKEKKERKKKEEKKKKGELLLYLKAPFLALKYSIRGKGDSGMMPKGPLSIILF